jgi:hypothetical protein
VPADRILLFLSPLSAVADDLDVSPQAATRQAITDAFETVIHHANGDLLYLFWGGHGAIDDDRRILFTADATEENLRSVNLNQMLYALRTDFYPGFNHQAIFVDACANYLYRSQSRFVTQPYEFVKGEPMSSRRQFSLYAAADGETARNDQTRRTGDFSDFVLNWLERNDQEQWPPRLDQLAEDVRRHFERRRLAKETHQTPLWIRHRSWQGNEDDLVGSQAEAGGRARLMQEVREQARRCEGIGTNQWLTFYRQTIPYVDRDLADAASRDQMIRNLALVNPQEQDYPKPLLEFVWRAARSLKNSGLEQWVEEKIDDYTLLENLKERVANEAPEPSLYLLVRPARSSSAKREFAREFDWWLWSETTNGSVASGSCKFRGDLKDLESNFIELLKEKRKEHPDGRLLLEFFLPDGKLSLGIERWEYLHGRLGDIHSVAVRWAERHQHHENWQKHTARIRRDKGRIAKPQVQWLPDLRLKKIAAHFENDKDCRALIGFSTSPEAAEETYKLLKTGLECGAPFLFWSRETEQGDFKNRFDKLVPQRHLNDFPESVRQLRQDDDDLSLVLLWDDPDRVPVKKGYSAQLLENDAK